MTEEEITRFALQLREAERVRAQIARDEAATHAGGIGDSIPVAILPAGELFFEPMTAAAA